MERKIIIISLKHTPHLPLNQRLFYLILAYWPCMLLFGTFNLETSHHILIILLVILMIIYFVRLLYNLVFDRLLIQLIVWLLFFLR